MHQFDVVANPFPHSRGRQPFLVALQSDLLTQSFDTVVVAPLEPADSRNFVDRLNPSVTVEGRSFVVVAQQLVTVRKSALGTPTASIAADRDKVIAALDLLFTGI
jgi:toxin CcdB